MLVDSHAHLNFQAFSDDLSQVIDRCRQVPMKVINVGARYDSSKKAVEMADVNNFYASLALHPIHVYDEEFVVDKFQELIDKNKGKIVAIGETGLDYWHLREIIDKGVESIAAIKQKQEAVFRAHIKLARDNDLPLIIHCRFSEDEPQAYDDVYRILKQEGVDRGVIHCYVGDLAGAKKFVDLGFYLGFNGIITFDTPSRKASEHQHPKPSAKDVDKIDDLREIVKWAPLDKMLIETDCPWLTPVPLRGKRNEPAYVKYVAQKIAAIRGMSVEEIIEITGNNAIKLFNLK